MKKILIAIMILVILSGIVTAQNNTTLDPVDIGEGEVGESTNLTLNGSESTNDTNTTAQGDDTGDSMVVEYMLTAFIGLVLVFVLWWIFKAYKKEGSKYKSVENQVTDSPIPTIKKPWDIYLSNQIPEGGPVLKSIPEIIKWEHLVSIRVKSQNLGDDTRTYQCTICDEISPHLKDALELKNWLRIHECEPADKTAPEGLIK